MLTKNCVYSLCLLFIFIGSACHKSGSEPKSDGTLLSRVVFHNYSYPSNTPFDTVTVYYNYNADGNLSSVISMDRTLSDSTFFVYDSQDQLINVHTISALFGSAGGYNFFYDERGRIIRKTGMSSPGVPSLTTHTYGYDVQNRVVADSLYYNDVPTAISAIVYEYTGNNVTKVTSYSLTNGTTYPESEISIFYDSHVNPYYQPHSVLYFARDQMEALSQSNAVPSDSFNGYHYTYDYYSNGLPKTIVYTVAATKSHTTYDFFYKN